MGGRNKYIEVCFFAVLGQLHQLPIKVLTPTASLREPTPGLSQGEEHVSAVDVLRGCVLKPLTLTLTSHTNGGVSQLVWSSQGGGRAPGPSARRSRG